MLHVDKNKVERRFTFEDISRASSRAANYFKSLGIKKGDKVTAGEVLAVIEAMKMQSNFKVSEDCVVREVLVKEGDLVNTDQVLVWLNLNGLEAYGE